MLTSSSLSSSSSSSIRDSFAGLLAEAESKLAAVTEELHWCENDGSIVLVRICDVTGEPDFFQTLDCGKVRHEQMKPERFASAVAVPSGFVAFSEPEFLAGFRDSMQIKVECLKKRAS